MKLCHKYLNFKTKIHRMYSSKMYKIFYVNIVVLNQTKNKKKVKHNKLQKKGGNIGKYLKYSKTKQNQKNRRHTNSTNIKNKQK